MFAKSANRQYTLYMNKYYSPLKDFSKRKKHHPIYSFTKAIIKLFFPKNEFIWKTEKPAEGEPVFFVCNHTKIYAPVYFLLQKEKVRVWSNYNFLFYKSCWQHLSSTVLKTFKLGFLLLPLAFILTPIIVWTFRAIEPIPVYHSDKNVLETFKKSIQTMEEGIPQVVFPECTKNQVNKYMYELHAGFPLVAQDYYDKTGKIMKFYPVYCAEALHTFLVGDPISYNPEIPLKVQRNDICRYIENKIAELGDSLPEHKPSLYV